MARRSPNAIGTIGLLCIYPNSLTPMFVHQVTGVMANIIGKMDQYDQASYHPLVGGGGHSGNPPSYKSQGIQTVA